MDFGGRKEIFRALVGSHNYNLNTETSDRDYKVFVAPTFDDLYFNKQFSKCYIGETEDFDCHDIRKISSLWWKANVNFLEVLYSQELHLNKNLNIDTKNYLQTIFHYKDEIVKMNLPYLYNACIGMHITKKKQIDKGTDGTQHLVDKYGYDTKQAMHSIRILDFLKRFADNEFSDFKGAIWYKDNEDFRILLLDLKNGLYSKEKFLNISDNLFNLVENEYKEKYQSQRLNEETNENLLKMVKAIVKSELK
jgi:predicted nucleotidyltransferase